LGASPQTPVVPLRGSFGAQVLLRSRTNAFCFFFWKKKNVTGRIKSSAKQNKRFLLLFLEKEGHYRYEFAEVCAKEDKQFYSWRYLIAEE
jgi:hypothetical protein